MSKENYQTINFQCKTPSSTSFCRKVLYELTKHVIENNKIKFPTKMDYLTISPERFTCFTDVKRHINNLPSDIINKDTFIGFYIEFEDDIESMPIYTIRIFKFCDTGSINFNDIEEFLEYAIPVYPKVLLTKNRKEFLKYIGVYIPFVEQLMSLIIDKLSYKNGIPCLKIIDILSENELSNGLD